MSMMELPREKARGGPGEEKSSGRMLMDRQPRPGLLRGPRKAACVKHQWSMVMSPPGWKDGSQISAAEELMEARK